MSFRVLGDGRKYIANFRTENWVVGSRNHDVWQAFLFARRGPASGSAAPTLSAAPFLNGHSDDMPGLMRRWRLFLTWHGSQPPQGHNLICIVSVSESGGSVQRRQAGARRKPP